MSKHMYDVYQLYSLPEIKRFLQSFDEVKTVIEIKKDEQLRRKEAKTQNKEINQFEYFKIISNSEIRESFDNMQRIYIFNEEFKVSFVDVLSCFRSILEQI
jgi:hypothetical protein